MKLTGFADEAAPDLATQIKATQELGWNYISTRGIDGTNIHDLSEEAFDRACDQLDQANIQIAEFGSLIGSWSKTIHSDFADTLAEVERTIPRMQRLGTNLVRVMSYAQEPWGEDQHEQERFRRLRAITSRFSEGRHHRCPRKLHELRGILQWPYPQTSGRSAGIKAHFRYRKPHLPARPLAD